MDAKFADVSQKTCYTYGYGHLTIGSLNKGGGRKDKECDDDQDFLKQRDHYTCVSQAQIRALCAKPFRVNFSPKRNLFLIVPTSFAANPDRGRRRISRESRGGAGVSRLSGDGAIQLSKGPLHIFGEHPSDHNHQDFPKSTAIQMGCVLQYKWEAYCDTNGRSTAIQMGGVLTVFPFPQSVGHQKSCNTNWRRTAGQIGGVLRYIFEK